MFSPVELSLCSRLILQSADAKATACHPLLLGKNLPRNSDDGYPRRAVVNENQKAFQISIHTLFAGLIILLVTSIIG